MPKEKKLPDLHSQAFMFKNTKRFQHDGGRAWIRDSQLYEARHNVNGRLNTISSEKKHGRVEQAEDHKSGY